MSINITTVIRLAIIERANMRDAVPANVQHEAAFIACDAFNGVAASINTAEDFVATALAAAKFAKDIRYTYGGTRETQNAYVLLLDVLSEYYNRPIYRTFDNEPITDVEAAENRIEAVWEYENDPANEYAIPLFEAVYNALNV